MVPSELELLGRLALATVLAGLIGAERELSDQPAGFRTHALVGLGAALFSIISAYGYQSIVGGEPDVRVSADITRVASQIVTGIGFLGGGAILKYGASVRGLTTAATLWTTAAIGTAVGVGAIIVGGGTALIALVAVVGLRPVRRLLRRYSRNTGELVLQTKDDVPVGAVLGEIESFGASIRSIKVDGRPQGGYAIRASMKLESSGAPSKLTERLADLDQVESVDWSEA
jgi:putative Mg2+ transporter-C (MgtC) family protein